MLSEVMTCTFGQFSPVTCAGIAGLLVSSIFLTAGVKCSTAAPQVSAAGSNRTTIELTGRVSDAETDEPLAAANVFISQTTRGTTTDSTGRYRLTVPPGSYDLVISMLGYETRTLSLNLTSQDKEVLRHDFALTPTVYEVDEMRVEGREDKVWQQRFEQFRREFLGSSPNARKTHIENPYAIEFEVSRMGTLIASSDRPFTVVNHALGYRILFQLEEFAYNERLDIFRYRGWSSFQLLEPETDIQTERWERNRERTYRGSLQHFLRTLVAGKTEEEGFYIKPYGAGTHPLEFRAIEPGKIVEETEESYLYRLSFDGDIQVIYVGSSENAAFRFGSDQSPGADEVSWLEIETQSVRIHELGYLYRPLALRRGGTMLHDRMADALPNDYRRDRAVFDE